MAVCQPLLQDRENWICQQGGLNVNQTLRKTALNIITRDHSAAYRTELSLSEYFNSIYQHLLHFRPQKHGRVTQRGKRNN
ncbi:conserved protein of unknown function [Ectopseudomonas oleovorans]|uniref:Uncharacterized protein n=1 Tax=Ectopseudomonas oleovorans TaxID=301 RepID=A0A653B3V9_ECTOL|nr:conserved protein of unknown function [Pseudomonas oleovorans]